MAEIIVMRPDCEVDVEKSIIMTRKILDMFDGTPAEDTKTMLNAMCVSLVKLMCATEKCCYMSEEDALVKLVLSWLASTDKFSNLNFSKYIKNL